MSTKAWLGRGAEYVKTDGGALVPVLRLPARKVVCAWHEKNFGEPLVLAHPDGIEPASHGICPECSRLEREAYKARQL